MRANDLRRKVEQNQRDKDREREAMERLFPRKREDDIAFALAQIKTEIDKVDVIYRKPDGREYFHVNIASTLQFEAIDRAIERFEAEFPEDYADVTVRVLQNGYRVIFNLKGSQ